MTEKQTASQAIIDRYLADCMDEAERAMVETRIVHDEGFRNEVMLTDALRDGLRQLEAQGQIEPLLAERSRMWRQAPIAVAAALLACAIGVATFLFRGSSEVVRPASGTQTLHFVRTRSMDARPDVIWQKPSEPIRIQMRFDVGVEPAAEYRVSIGGLSGGATASVFEIVSTTTNDGDVAITVDSERLEPGNYGILLEPMQPGGAQSATRYVLRISD